MYIWLFPVNNAAANADDNIGSCDGWQVQKKITAYSSPLTFFVDTISIINIVIKNW